MTIVLPKKAIKFVTIVGIFFCLYACKQELDASTDHKTPPQYNFLIRVLPLASSKDTIQMEIYIRQLDYENPNEKYRFIVTFPIGFDGTLYHQGASFRSGDWITLSYKQFQDYCTIVKLRPGQLAPGNYILTIHCTDEAGQSKSASLSIELP